MADDQPGKLFSEVYYPRQESVKDDPRMRRRMSALFYDVRWESADYVGPITMRLGIDVPSASYSYDWQQFFAKTPINDLLDAITLISQVMRRQSSSTGNQWLGGIQQIFDQQNAPYRIEPGGGVRFRVDAAMTALTTSAIATLNKPEFGQVSEHLDAAMSQIDRSPGDFAGAIRGVFFAVEELFKLKFPQAQRLAAFEIDAKLGPVARKMASGKAAVEATPKAIESFKDWVSACHEYRHAKGDPEPAQPNPDLGILLISQGLSWARWLSSISIESD